MKKLSTIIKENLHVEDSIDDNPSAFKFLKTDKQKSLFTGGYNYAIRDVLILLEKLGE